jgi:arylsulfatase A-like enzyme
MGQMPTTPARARYLNASWNRGDLGPTRLAQYRDDVVGLYDAGIRWMDVQVARLIDGLRGSNRWEDCILALTADHGEEFLEHGGRFHAPDHLTEELIRVPLLVRVPGVAKKEVSKSPFSLLHLAPTLLDAAQLSIPSAFHGRSQWQRVREGASNDDVAISEFVVGCLNPFRPENRFGPRALSIRDSRFKLVLYFDPPAEYLYDLESDPGEQAPLAAAAQKPVRRRLLEIAREHLRRSSDGRDQRTRTRARLRELELEWARSFPQRPAS